MKVKIVHYTCDCGYVANNVLPLKQRDSDVCPKCGLKQRRVRIEYPRNRTIHDFKNKGGVDALMRDNERWSWSMGINPEDIPKAMKQFPNATYHPKTGQLLVRNRAHKLRQMKERGLVECDGYRNRNGVITKRRKHNGR